MLNKNSITDKKKKLRKQADTCVYIYKYQRVSKHTIKKDRIQISLL